MALSPLQGPAIWYLPVSMTVFQTDCTSSRSESGCEPASSLSHPHGPETTRLPERSQVILSACSYLMI